MVFGSGGRCRSNIGGINNRSGGNNGSDGSSGDGNSRSINGGNSCKDSRGRQSRSLRNGRKGSGNGNNVASTGGNRNIGNIGIYGNVWYSSNGRRSSSGNNGGSDCGRRSINKIISGNVIVWGKSNTNERRSWIIVIQKRKGINIKESISWNLWNSSGGSRNRGGSDGNRNSCGG